MYHKFHNSILISIWSADLFVAYNECKQTHAQPTANVRMSLIWRHRSEIFQKTCTLLSYNGGNVWLWICNTRHSRMLSDDDMEVVRLEGPRKRHNTRASHVVNVASSALQTARVVLDGLCTLEWKHEYLYKYASCASVQLMPRCSEWETPYVLLRYSIAINQLMTLRRFGDS